MSSDVFSFLTIADEVKAGLELARWYSVYEIVSYQPITGNECRLAPKIMIYLTLIQKMFNVLLSI